MNVITTFSFLPKKAAEGIIKISYLKDSLYFFQSIQLDHDYIDKRRRPADIVPVINCPSPLCTFETKHQKYMDIHLKCK